MIPILVIGGITAAIALLAKHAAPATAAAPAAGAPPIGSSVTPTPSTPTAVSHTIEAPIFSSPDQESLYQAALRAREASGIPIQAAPQPAKQTVPVFAGSRLFSGLTAPRLVAPVAPAPARTPIAQVGTGGGGISGLRNRPKLYSLF